MTRLQFKTFCAAGLLVCASSCGVVSQQLGDKAAEDRLLKPGALDASLTNVYDTYQFKFLDKYRVTHDWHRNANGCQYRARPTLGVKNGLSGEFFAVADIFELNGSTFQSVADLGRPPRNFDQFVRSKKVMDGVWETVNGVRQKVGEKEIENGWTPVCFEAWTGTNHSLVNLLFKRSIAEWEQVLPVQGFVKPSTKATIGSNDWRVYKSTLQPPVPNRNAGPFEMWILPIGKSGYTIAMALGANQQSLQNPQAHAQFQAALAHLVRSVKIEEIKP